MAGIDTGSSLGRRGFNPVSGPGTFGSNPTALVHGMLVAGSGTPSVNGVYLLVGVVNGKNYYQLPATLGYIYWYIDAPPYWAITTVNAVPEIYDYSFDDVATPDLVTTWVRFSGPPPVPTVTSQ